MIVSSMSLEEIYENLAKDERKVEYRKEYYLPKAIKELKKSIKFPDWRRYNYTIPSTNNKYVLFYYANNLSEIKKPLCNSFFVFFDNNQKYIILWGKGVFKDKTDNSLKHIKEIRVFREHFFKRYNERFLKDDSLSINDIACDFFARNQYFTPVEINNEINKNIENYDEAAKYGFQIRDGFCFARMTEEEIGKEYIIMTVFSTFISESEMSPEQRNAINKGAWEKWRAYLECKKNN